MRIASAFSLTWFSLMMWLSLQPIRSEEQNHQLTVQVRDVQSKSGQLCISIFYKEDGFPENAKKAYQTAKVAWDKPTHTFTLPAGSYAVVVFHDLNQDGKLDRSIIGIPREPIGLSNYPTLGGKSGRPDFEKTKIMVNMAKTVDINLIEVGK